MMDSPLLGTLDDFPAEACTPSGSIFYPRDEIWKPWDITGPRYFNFALLRSRCSSSFVLSARKVFLWYLENSSVSGSFTRFGDLIHILQLLDDEEPSLYPRKSLEPNDVLRARALLGVDQEYRLLSVRFVLVRWANMGYAGVPLKTAQVLERLKLKGNDKGLAVTTMDPEVGPFIEAEVQQIHAAANEAFVAGDLSLRSYCMLWIFFALGPRPIQVALLKIQDLKVFGSAGASETFILEVPRVKQRDEHVRRQSFRGRPLIPDIGNLVRAQCQDVLRQADSCNLGLEEIDNLPLFPTWGNSGAPDLQFHTFSDDIAKEFASAINSLGVVSCRTGAKIKVTTYRFRRTLGTRAAQEGLSEYAIAELLDHSSLQSAMVYVKAVPKILQNIDKALAHKLAPIFSSFRGEIIQAEKEPGGRQNSTPSLKMPHHEDACGCCGHDGDCNVLAPIGCYVCPHFQALSTGPHDQVLEELLQRRQSTFERTKDLRIASVNDQLIFAVAQTVQASQALTSQYQTKRDQDG